MSGRFDATWMRQTLSALATRRPVFHSEADFQHALAWQIQLTEPEAAVRLETRPFAHRRLYLDVAVTVDDQRIAIELKHLTHGLAVDLDGERYSLLNQAAHDIARYDVVKDIERVEQLITEGLADRGYVVVLSNDQAHWRPGTKADPVDLRFRLHEGARLHGVAAWSAAAGAGTTRGRERPIELAGDYTIAWDDYSRIADGPAGRFRYLLIEARPEATSPHERSGPTISVAAGADDTTGVAPADDRTARAQILKAVAILEQQLGRRDLALFEIVDEVQRCGTELAVSTIRTYVTSVMCVDAPSHHAVRYPDLRRVDRGRYVRLLTPDRSSGAPDPLPDDAADAATMMPDVEDAVDATVETYDVERQFDRAMVGVYESAKSDAGYTATRFIQLVSEVGGLAAARRLLHGPPSDGFTALWERGRLDLTVEALVLDDRYRELFSDDERDTARTRLGEYGFPV